MRAATVDAGISFSDIEFLSFGTTSETNNAAQRLMGQIGYLPIPAFNVANGCATGAVALRLAIQAIRAGDASMALAVGAQVMGKAGLLGNATSVTNAAAGLDTVNVFTLAPPRTYGLEVRYKFF